MADRDVKSSFSLVKYLRPSAILLALILEGLNGWHAWSVEKEHNVQSVINAITLALLVLIAEQIIELNLHLEQSTETDTEWTYYLLRARGLIGDLGRRLHVELRTTLKREDGGFECCNRYLAIHSYEEFWQLLLDAPEKGHIQALHTGEVSVFNPDQEQPLLELQSQFIHGGGKIARILCYRYDVDKLPDTIAAMAKEMLKRNMDVYYCKRGLVPQMQRIEWDFLRIAETDDAAVWTLTPEGQIKGASFTKSKLYDSMELKSLWEQVKARSSVLKLDPATKELVAVKV